MAGVRTPGGRPFFLPFFLVIFIGQLLLDNFWSRIMIGVSSATNHFLTKYHCRGELPRILPNGDPTRLARKYEELAIPEDSLSLKEKYKDLFVINQVIVPGGKGISRKCLACFDSIKDTPSSSFSNFIKHVGLKHRCFTPTEGRFRGLNLLWKDLNSP